MISTQIFPCTLPKDVADRLNRESGRIYTRVLVEHYRILRHSDHWLSPGAGEKLNDYLSGTILHAHSRDAAQQGFYKACKTAKAQKSSGMGPARYPHHLKTFRTTYWKNTGIRKQEGVLLLALARGNDPIRVRLPAHLTSLPAESFIEMRLVWDRAGRRYNWHSVIEDGRLPADPPGKGVAAVDLGEVHPAAVTDGAEGLVFCARELRSLSQYTHKRLAEFQSMLSKKEKHSRRYQRMMARKTRFLAKQKRRRRDIEHKVSRSVVNYAVERGVGTLATVQPILVQFMAQQEQLDPRTMTTKTFWHAVARLGGFPDRRSDGEPGWRRLWDGWMQLLSWVDGARLASNLPPL